MHKTCEILAIGYSTRAPTDLIRVLKAHGVTLVADVRTIPKSRHQPGFNSFELKKLLSKYHIKYHHFELLGGLRKPLANSLNKGWTNLSFRGFADYMQTEEFAKGLNDLIKRAHEDKVVLMCAEGNPFRCHRSLIADALTVMNIMVFHISSVKSLRRHKLTPFAKVKGLKITYPPNQNE